MVVHLIVLGLMVVLAATLVADVVVQTSAYEQNCRHEVARLNHIARLRGEPQINLETYKESIIEANLAAVANKDRTDN